MATKHSAGPRDAADWFERADRRYRVLRSCGGALCLLLGLALLAGEAVRPAAAPSGAASSPELGAVFARLAQLESQNLHLRLAAGLALLAAGALVLLGSVLRLHTVEAGRLVLRDRRGRLRVGLTPETGLVFLDGEQRPRVELSTYHDVASLKLFDASRLRRVELTETPDGALLAISDATTKPRVAMLGVSHDGPAVSLTDSSGAGNFAISGEGPNVVLHHRGAGRATLDVTAEGPRLHLAEPGEGGRSASLSPAPGSDGPDGEAAPPDRLPLAS